MRGELDSGSDHELSRARKITLPISRDVLNGVLFFLSEAMGRRSYHGLGYDDLEEVERLLDKPGNGRIDVSISRSDLDKVGLELILNDDYEFHSGRLTAFSSLLDLEQHFVAGGGMSNPNLVEELKKRVSK